MKRSQGDMMKHTIFWFPWDPDLVVTRGCQTGRCQSSRSGDQCQGITGNKLKTVDTSDT